MTARKSLPTLSALSADKVSQNVPKDGEAKFCAPPSAGAAWCSESAEGGRQSASFAARLRAISTEEALVLVARIRPQLHAFVADLRATELSKLRSVKASTGESYSKDAARCLVSGLDLVSMSGTAASFWKLKAACQYVFRTQLKASMLAADRARKAGNELEQLRIYHDDCRLLSDRIRHVESLVFDSSKAIRKERTHKQRNKLSRLPLDWVGQVFKASLRGRGKSLGKYADAVACSSLIALRPAELALGVRVWTEGGALVFQAMGVKVQAEGSGKASGTQGIGQQFRVVRVDAVDPSRQPAFDHLMALAKSSTSASPMLVSVESSTAFESAFRQLSARLFSSSKAPPSLYALRHAIASEMKASGASPSQIALAMGHAAESSQGEYGAPRRGSGFYQFQAAAPLVPRVDKAPADPGGRIAKNKLSRARTRGPAFRR